jgi:hypothetical protein
MSRHRATHRVSRAEAAKAKTQQEEVADKHHQEREHDRGVADDRAAVEANPKS